MALNRNFLNRIQDVANGRPLQPTDEPQQDELLSPAFTQRIQAQAAATTKKTKYLDRLESTPIVDRLLDAKTPLSDAVLKYRIQYAGSNALLLFITYNGIARYVEPYSYRVNGKPLTPGGPRTLRLYAYCRTHNTISSFDPKKISQCLVTEQPFRNRWKIELGS